MVYACKRSRDVCVALVLSSYRLCVVYTLQKCKGYFNLSVVISVASILLDVHLDCMHDFNTPETEVECVGSPQV